MIAPALIQTDDDGNLTFAGTSWEEHVEAWREIQESVTEHFWALGAIGDSLARNYGDGDIKRFAQEVGLSQKRIYKLVSTYRGWRGKQRSQMLSFTHHEEALRAPDPVEAIEKAEEEGWSSRQLARWVDERAGRAPREYPEDPDPPKSIVVPQSGSELNAWISRIRSRPCMVRHLTGDGSGCSGSVEFAHLEAIPSRNHQGYIGRRDGLGMWPGVPLCAGHHRTRRDSVHELGEPQFVEKHLGGYKRAFGWILGELVGFILDSASNAREVRG